MRHHSTIRQTNDKLGLLASSTASERAQANMEAIFHEGHQLQRDGKLDEGAKTHIEEQLRGLAESLDRQVENELDSTRTGTKRPQRSVWEKIAAIVLLLAFIAMPLEFTVGESFVFFFSNAYKAELPTLFALTLPVFAIFWFRLEKRQQALPYRYPTWTIRWLIVFPLIVVLSTTMLVLSPFGWSALAGWVIGTDTPPRHARVLSVDPERRRAGRCDQKAMLDFNGTQTNICIEGRVVGPVPKAGNTVSIRGRNSFLGLFIEEIRVVRSS